MKQASGNVLFLILIAVALFAALSYAVTQSSRSGSGGIERDKAKLYAAQFVQYGTAIEQAIGRMRVINRTPEYGIDLASSVTWSSSANATCTTNVCKVFHVEGGGISPAFIDEKAFDTSLGIAPTIFRHSVFRAVSVVDVGSDLDELVLIIAGLKKEVCAEINKSMGIIDGGNPPTDVYTGYGDYRGTLTAFPEATAVQGDGSALFEGKRTFCAYYNAATGYTFYHVLMER